MESKMFTNESLDKHISKLCRDLAVSTDAGIMEEVISLFNNGVLKLYITIPKHQFDPENMKLTVSQCARINFEGKEKIIELENLLQSERDMALELERRLAVAVEALEKCSKANERGVEHEGFRLSRIDISVWAKLALTEITKPSIPHKEEK